MGKIIELLHEFQDLFPTIFFSEMKGIFGDLGKLKIPLRPDAKMEKQWPYRLNPFYKEKVKVKLDRMLETGVIEPVEESEWISPIMVQDKKTSGEVRFCVDLRKLNDACLHDPFLTPFIYEVLENVGGQEMYSFTDGFSGYHQVQIAKQNRYKPTFAIEWGCYQYTIMPFGLKNSPATFSRIVVAAFKYFIHKFIEVYFNDWTVFGIINDHIEGPIMMLKRCHQYKILLNLKKCIFCVPFGIFLVHVVFHNGILVDPTKIAIIADLPSPTIVKQLRKTLGHT